MSEIIEIGDLRVKRQREGLNAGNGCKHLQLEFEDRGEVITCRDCKRQITAYWAFGMIVAEYLKWREKFNREYKSFKEETSKELVLIAAKRVEKAWRSKSMAPSCPHCSRGILSTDMLGNSSVNKEMELRRRKVEGKP